MYQALYRKYRPKTFSEVVGQEHITTTLQRQVADGKTAHAYLFTGTRGTGKTTCARILAKAVNCTQSEDGAPCCRCAACVGIDSGALLDVTELDAASNNGVEQVRALREEAVYSPSVLQRRVYIIDEVHMLSTAAFNALLKILEEPPAHLLFILATTELHKVPATILSRCQRFSFKRIMPRDMEKQLLHIAEAEHICLTPDGAEILSRMANGALRDALSLLDQCRVAETIDSAAVLNTLGLAGSTQTVALMRCLLSENAADALRMFNTLYQDGKDIAALLGELADLGRELTIVKAAPEGGSALLSGLYDSRTLAELSKRTDIKRCLFLTSTLQACCAALGDSPRPRTDAELCLLRLCDPSLCGDTSALEVRIAKIEQALRHGIPVNAKSSETPPPSTQPMRPTQTEQPPFPEEPPLPEPPPLPEELRRTVPKSAAPSHTDGDGSIWNRLIDHYKGRLPAYQRVFLNRVSGAWDGECLRVICPDDFTRDSLDKDDVRKVLREVTEKELGHPIRMELTVGTAAASTPKSPAPKAAAAPTASRKAPPPAPIRDAMEELKNSARQLESFKVKGE